MLHLVGISFLNHKMMGQIKEAKKLWQDGIAKNITFIVTKDCQLACKYCYLVGKNSKERMSWDIAKQAIDYILDNHSLLLTFFLTNTRHIACITIVINHEAGYDMNNSYRLLWLGNTPYIHTSLVPTVPTIERTIGTAE